MRLHAATIDPVSSLRGPSNIPFRAELFGPDHLDELARTRAAEWPVDVRPGARPVLHRLRENAAVLRRARDVAAAAATRDEPLTPDAEWLLDNFFVIEDVFREVRTDLPSGYYDELPVVTGGDWAGFPRVYALAVELLTHTDSHLDEAQVLRFVRAFQQVASLTTGELWAVPTTLRLALLENLRRLAGQMLQVRADRERAVAWVQAATATTPPPDAPSDAFLVGWYQAVRDLGDSTQTPLAADWLIAQAGDDLSEVLRREHRRQAANQVSVGNCVTSLRLLQAIDWAAFFEQASPVEDVLRAEPTGVYARQEFATRDRYRQAVEQMAKASRRDELEVARRAVARAAAADDPRTKHVGYHLVADGRKPFARELGCRFKFRDRWRTAVTDHPNLAFFGGLFVLTALLCALAGWLTAAAGGGPMLVVVAVLVAVLPVSEVAVRMVNHVVCKLLPPRVLPKLDFTTGIPADCRTVVVIPGMLTSPSSAANLCERLELHYLANPDPQLRFALLTDWADAATETTPKDEPLVAGAVGRIRALNERYAKGGPDLFFLFHRKRLWNPAERAWMGWERKRGKLEEFNHLLHGRTDTTYSTRTGDAAELHARFVLTLDADTVLPRDAARRLIATLAHPLNRPVLSAEGRRVVSGYGLLQPRVSFLYRTGLRSRFARIFAGSAGIDPYSAAASDVYQDLFAAGTFTGKGLYDVAAFAATAGRAFPDNAVLSHDLIESNYARCGLVTDVEVFDDFPAKYHAYAKREHRWVRGDWQLLPWLGRKVPTPSTEYLPNPLTALGRWKVFDNLRRSLVPVGLVLMLAVAWLALPGPGWWSLAAVAVLAVPFLLLLWDTLAGLVRAESKRAVLKSARQHVGSTLGQTGLLAAVLANQAVFAADAVARTLYRLGVSRRKMLEWETAAAAEARLGGGLGQFVRIMLVSVLLAAGLTAAVAVFNPAALPAALPWLLAWLLAPGLAYWVSQPLADHEPPLTPAVRTELRRTARKVWRFFDTFVTAADHYLPPDNYQEHPKGAVAHRTSPTNSGLLLVSTLSAHDLGYTTTTDVAARLGRTLDTLERLDKHRGHCLNWYETTTLRPLPPAYVSTVDSGNLLACLLTTKNGLAELATTPVPSPALVDGLRDTLDLRNGPSADLTAHLDSPPADLLGWHDWLERADKLTTALGTPDGEAGVWAKAAAAQVQAARSELAAVCPWLDGLRAVTGPIPATDELLVELNTPTGPRRWAERLPRLHAALTDRLPSLPADMRPAAETLAAALERSQARALVGRLDALALRCRELADGMDFRFLYSESRHLFSIGYNVPLERLDAGHYDLLASEAATTSFLMVARGVVPRKHWFMLGRLVTNAAGRPGLISWGGSLFEYLMPRLFLRPAPDTLLDVAQKAAVARQQEYARQLRLPWGVSESGFAVLSAEQDYQYQSFGVPGLGLKRGLAKDRVVAPYATLLATLVDAPAAVANLPALRAAGGEGPFGFYEAIDYTPDRLDRGQKCQVVKSYMAHHQGMALAAISNRLTGDAHCRRLHAEPAVRAVELLLQERVPLEAPEVRGGDDSGETATPAAGDDVSRRLTRVDTPAPRGHLLSNGQYTVMLTHAGGGFSTCRGLAVGRWRTDPTRDCHGSFLYVRDTGTRRVWSAGYQPTRAVPDSYEVTFSADKAEFRRVDGRIETFLEVTVAPDQDVEVRRLTLANHDTKPHTLEVTSYQEIVLNDPRADVAHPAFGKLFLETEWLPHTDALLCRRRPRSSSQQPVFAVHVIASDEPAGKTEYETDRAKFLGRRRDPTDPAALDRRLTGTVGPVLDPVFSLRRTLTLPPGSSATLVFVTAVTQNREAAVAVADHYHTPAAAARAFDLAWAHSRVELRHLGITAAESHLFQRLAGHMLFPPAGLRSAAALKENRQPQPALWRHGIGGDLPLLAVTVSDSDGLPLAKQALQAHSFWRSRGFPVELLLLADRPASYREELYESLAALARGSDSREVIDKPGGVFVRKAQPGDPDRNLFLSTARVVLYGDRGTLADQTDAVGRSRPLPPPLLPVRSAEPHVPEPRPVDGLVLVNGVGGFTPDGREYVVTGVPPLPWCNVIANPLVGCITTDAGLGYTWAGNSQANRLTPWSNDPVADPPAEVVYLRDEETGAFWTPTPLPVRGSPTVVRHGAGYTSYTQERNGLATELIAFVPATDPVKIVRLRVTNTGGRSRTLSAAFFADWVLGPSREQSAAFVVTEIDPASGALLARNPYDADFGTRTAFADTSLRPRTLTGDRQEFVGRNRSPADPAALGRIGLSDHAGAGLDPCAALLGRFTVAAGAMAEVVFVLGQAADADAAGRLAMKYREPAAAEAALGEVAEAWDRRLSAVRVTTPDPAFDLLVNRWLPYQTLACRVWGRSALYQSGGAYGFRDQLQDVLALLYADPAEARAHIVRAAARQFPEGDVQHWWHPPSGRGVRTRFSDDFLWLPYAVARYIEVTGDASILDEEAPLLHGPVLRPDQHEEYFQPDSANDGEAVYVHCRRALAHGWKLGPHGLPLMGCGDWNDGMNLVGAGGVGESVWVGWFQVIVRRQFAEIADRSGEREDAALWRKQADQLLAALDAHAWDGGWYRRAWFDDGTPLGSATNDECQLDSLPQSWAVLAGGDPERAETGVNAALARLVNRNSRLVKLFDPPFDAGNLNPGYIKGYVPGTRENGGQYTHAAVWLVQAVARLGRGTEAFGLWRMLNPLTHTDTPAGVNTYKGEPYVLAGDVYGRPPHTGRVGWSWYTGSAGWLYRAAVETLIGFTKRGDTLTFDPRIPGEWRECVVEYVHGDGVYRCVLENPDGVEQGVREVWLDGTRVPDLRIPLRTEPGQHAVRVVLGKPGE